jgi:hypothetical protein
MAAKAFVGRQRELDELNSTLADVRAGAGALFIVVGGAGMGKTRFADEVTRAARGQGFQAVWGRCWETGGAPAYWPFIQVLRELLRGEGATLLAAVGSAKSALAQLMPDLVAAEAGAMPAGVSADAAVDARFRLFDAVGAVLREAAARAPLLIVLDDLHMADPSSLALLHFVARNLRGVRALLLCTYRDEEARLRPEAGQTLADVAREGTYLPLAPLSDDDVAVMVASLTGQTPDRALRGLIEEIRRTTEGNPLFLDQLLRLLLQRGELTSPVTQAGRLPVPETVRDVIRRRFSRLGAEVVEVLAEAAVLGREWSRAALLALGERRGGGFAGHAVDAAVAAAERAALLVPMDEGRWRFSHVLVGETLYRDLSTQRRAELHLQIAGLLAEGGQEALAEIAHHRLAALPEGDVVLAAEAARRAADHAAGMLAFEDAAALLEQAHAALQAAHVGDARLACELSLAAGFARMRAGDITRGRALCEGAAQEARRLGDGELFARCALGYGAELMIARTEETLQRLLSEALLVLPPGPSGLRAQVMARLAAARQPAANPLEPVAVAREAVAMARALAAPPEVLRGVLYFAGSAMAEYAEPAERASVSEELAALASAAHDRPQLLRAHARLVFDYLELSELDKSRESIKHYEDLARVFGQPRHIWPGRFMRAMLAAATGNFAEAERYAAEGRALAAGDTDLMTTVSLTLHRLGEVLQRERLAEVPDLLVELEATLLIPRIESMGRDIFHATRATLLACLTDNRDEVARSLDCLSATFVRYEYPAMGTLADAVFMVGHRKLAEVMYEPVARTAHRLITSAGSDSCVGGRWRPPRRFTPSCSAAPTRPWNGWRARRRWQSAWGCGRRWRRFERGRRGLPWRPADRALRWPKVFCNRRRSWRRRCRCRSWRIACGRCGQTLRATGSLSPERRERLQGQRDRRQQLAHERSPWFAKASTGRSRWGPPRPVCATRADCRCWPS